MVFSFDNPLFQRGMTWSECKETWLPQRDRFLQYALQAELLTETFQAMATMGYNRMAIVFNPMSTDSLMSLPFIGKTLNLKESLQVRYFDFTWFFPVFFPHLDRKVPQLLVLKDDGSMRASWGPRPQSITEKMPGGRAADSWLTSWNEENYRLALDASVARFLLEL